MRKLALIKTCIGRMKVCMTKSKKIMKRKACKHAEKIGIP